MPGSGSGSGSGLSNFSISQITAKIIMRSGQGARAKDTSLTVALPCGGGCGGKGELPLPCAPSLADGSGAWEHVGQLIFRASANHLEGPMTDGLRLCSRQP